MSLPKLEKTSHRKEEQKRTRTLNQIWFKPQLFTVIILLAIGVFSFHIGQTTRQEKQLISYNREDNNDETTAKNIQGTMMKRVLAMYYLDLPPESQR